MVKADSTPLAIYCSRSGALKHDLRFTIYDSRLLEFLRPRVGVVGREFDGLLAARDVDGQTPREFERAVDRGVHPPLAGRDGNGRLSALVQLDGERLAVAHSLRPQCP